MTSGDQRDRLLGLLDRCLLVSGDLRCRLGGDASDEFRLSCLISGTCLLFLGGDASESLLLCLKSDRRGGEASESFLGRKSERRGGEESESLLALLVKRRGGEASGDTLRFLSGDLWTFLGGDSSEEFLLFLGGELSGEITITGDLLRRGGEASPE